ncbi:hypothetical protein [Ilyobacter polytropus]|uniref:Uncharacterized protein n=1 Tax=Ilyobacter polytropus (strain ATCC 51220 / DSM 2926 / LMG 16218 / CuHBu1) TaxID=572544 RepID=E3HBP9_ILYPC|nr:hypothetical protein [Ilyobacter polytropus]ADO83811.1 hypothetical protein Ilyop_2040 [Ilyobacter polytropus DSM 2926]
MKYYHYAIKIFDSLRSGTNDESPLYVATGEGIYLDGIECLAIANTPSDITSSIMPTDSKCSVSSSKIRIGNPDYSISQWFYERQNSEGTMTYGEKVEIYAVDADKNTYLIYMGIIREINNDTLETYYEIEVADVQERLKTSIFDREFSNYQAESISDINAYRLPHYDDGGTRKGFTIIEQDEGDTDDSGNAVNTRVITFNGHVIDFVEMIYQIAFSTDTLDVQVFYLSNDWQDFVDLDSFNSVRASLSSSSYQFYFEFREAVEDPYEYLKENIYKPCAIFPYVNSQGKLGIKLHKQPQSSDEVATFSEENIVSVDKKAITDNNVVNHIQCKYGWKFKDDEESVIRYFGNATSYNKFRMFIPTDSPQEIEIRGINNLSDTARATFAQGVTDAIFSRYALPSIEISLTVPLEEATSLKAGDYVFFSHNTVVAWEGDNPGLAGIGAVEDEEDPFGGLAFMDLGVEWGAFIDGNNLGKAIDGTWVVTTTEAEISHKLFNDTTDPNFKSCLENHNSVSSFLSNQGGY